MKKRIISILILLSSLTTYGQTKIEEKIISKYLKDTVRCTIWLPENWNSHQKYTTIYTFSYGASDAEFIAEQIKYLNKLHISSLPPNIIVNIWADMDLIGYNYETGSLTDRGSKTVGCLKNEIIPLLERKYNASRFRTYIGQSYGASYGNYLFLNQPEIFSAYIIMSPERIADSQPPFDITGELEKFYGQRRTYYFAASGALDMQRRQDYVKDISEKLSKLNSSKLSYRTENFSIAGHNNSLAVGLPVALDFIFQQYASFPQPDSSGKISTLIKKYENNLSEIYGIGVDKQSSVAYSPLLPLIWQKKDSTGLVDAINYFVNKESNIMVLRDFAYSSSIVGLNESAKQLYNQAISRGLANQKASDFYPGYLITCYREKAALADNAKEGWDLLQKALQICTRYKSNIYNSYYPTIYYYLGKFASEKSYKVEGGITYLQLYIEKQKDIVTFNQFPLDKAYYYLGSCYASLKDNKNSKIYLQKAIEINPENKSAKKLLESLR